MGEINVNIITAMMLLEIGLDGIGPDFCTLQDCATAAHSFLQVENGGRHSWDGAADMAARIMADSAIELAKRK